MSGPVAIEYVLVSALLDAAWGAYEQSQQRRAEEARREEALAQRRERDRTAAIARREEERRAREEARRRVQLAQALGEQARSQERRLAQARKLADEARLRFAGVNLEIPDPPAPPADTDDLDRMRAYLEQLQASVGQVQSRIREHALRAASEQGLNALMSALEQTLSSEPRTAGDLLTLYAQEVRALGSSAAARAMDRRETAARIIGRLTGMADGAVPSELDATMRRFIEAPTEARAELLAMELRAQVQRLNEARERAEAAAEENRRREVAGVLVAEVLTDLGYEVEPIAETLFVSGGVAHFQRAQWGDYYVRMRVDPDTKSVNFNMVRTSASASPPDGAQRKRDAAMEAAWCAGIPKLLAELAARGIDTRKLRELDAGAVPVQVVPPESVDPVLRKGDAQTQAARTAQQMARPIE